MSILLSFSERLKELMFDNELSYENLATQTAINIDYIYGWTSKKNQSLPTVANLVKLANCFNCTLEFLLGIAEDSYCNSFLQELPPLATRLKIVIAKYNYNLYKLGMATNTSTTTYYRWLNGKAYPNIESLIKIANELDCTLDYLIGREK